MRTSADRRMTSSGLVTVAWAPEGDTPALGA